MDYRLEGLGPHTFEQLVQAIAVRQIGPGVVVFGDGKDGGREATFRGLIPNLGSGDWDGSLVVQAKFRKRLKSTQADGKWALAQLADELRQYRSGDRPRPDYYLFATNVTLTPVAERGTKDLALALLDEAVADGTLRDYDVWDRDKLHSFIDLDRDLRSAYGAWITPGDVLAAMAEGIVPSVPKLDDVLSRFLQKQLVAEQYANLGQAGSTSDDRVPVAKVFFDLPLEPSGYDLESHDSDAGFVAQFVEAAHLKLQSAAPSAPAAKGHDPQSSRPLDARWVLVGGPGQGKTTAGQFVCQLFRAATLLDRPPEEMSAEALQALGLIEKRCAESGIPLPTVRRFPLRVVLSEFASDLQRSDGKLPLLRFLADKFGASGEEGVTVDVLRSWLAGYPWLIVLDGLDEVPSSSNRDAVMRAIDDFWVDVSESRCDALVLATTRPQGYNDEFSPRLYRHCHLAPLEPAQALSYARQVVHARHEAETDRCKRILTRLERAAAAEATARLMRSPLQVTIMATLVEQMGHPPEQRWSLFSQYYNVIYNREMERDIPAAQILRDHRPDIDRIHRRVALVLQRESERAGNTQAHLSSDRFAAIVEERLREEAHSDEGFERLRDAILLAAAERLVFVVGLEADRVGFEIRSLQEFMAAEALLDGPDALVADRLRAIAPASAWRNVFLFAAGRCFADRQHLRDTVYAIAAELNECADGLAPVDALSGTARLGATLAVEILEDGLVRDQPRFRELLSRVALRALDRPAGQIHVRLADLYDGAGSGAYQEVLEGALGRVRPRSGVWRTLARLIERDVAWAEEILIDRWPQDPSAEQELLLELAGVTHVGVPLRMVIGQAALRHPPRWESPMLQLYDSIAELDAPWAPLFARLWPYEAVEIGAADDPTDQHVERFSRRLLELVSVEWDPMTDSEIELPEGAHGYWRVLAASVEFNRAPRPELLADLIERLADAEPITLIDRDEVPWPLLACLAATWDGADRAAIASAARAGRLGTFDDWVAAEGRWEVGVEIKDLQHHPADGLPFDDKIGVVGIPLGGFDRSVADDLWGVAVLESWLTFAASPATRRLVADWALALDVELHIREIGDEQLPVERFRRFVEAAYPKHDRAAPWSVFYLGLLEVMEWPNDLETVAHALDVYGRLAPELEPFRDEFVIETIISECLKLRPDGAGLWRLLAACSLVEEIETSLPIPLDQVLAISPVAGRLLQVTVADLPVPRAEEVITAFAGEPAWIPLLDRALRQATMEGDYVELLLDADAAAGTPGNIPDATLGPVIDEALARRDSALQDPETYARLGLVDSPRTLG